MSLSVGIVGLPNAGKSTLFNALASRRLAETDIRPFTTIDPHEAVVPVVDSALIKLSMLIKPDDTVPASIKFIDIAGLIKGAHKGEGLGNQFLSKIREVDAIVHVVRAFENPQISHQHADHTPGSIDQIMDDIEVINIELRLGEINKTPTIYVLNTDEDNVNNIELVKKVEEKYMQQALLISAQTEEGLIEFNKQERKDYLKEIGLEKSGLERLVAFTYDLLDLITFYTIKGGKEVHAWSLSRGKSVMSAAETVHTDFAANFIKAEVINVEDLLKKGGWKQAGEKGKIRLEGKDYVVQNKDVIEFKVNV